MATKVHSHQHPDYSKRITALEKLTKKLEKQLAGVQHKLRTHRHPHAHSH
jgi:ribosome-associated translation inhibitor RaiA